MGRRTTCVNKIRDDVTNAGAIYEDAPLVVDGNLISSRTPADMDVFNQAVVDAMNGTAELACQPAISIASAMPKGYILDMDGVLYRGHEPLPGTPELLDALALRDIPYRFVTNNSTSTPEQYVVKLAGMGIDTTADLILTSGVATRHYLHDSMPEGGTVFAIGEPALMEQLYVDPTLKAPG